MKRLWVRLSLAISILIAITIILPFGSLFFYIETQETELPEVNSDEFDILVEVIGEQSRPVLEAVPETVIITFLFSGLIGIGIGIWISRSLSAPISRLAQATQRIGSGDLSHRVDVAGSQEITDLAQSFNKMAADLQQAEQLRRNLMADVSHELNTPLTVLEGHLRAALDHVYELDEAEIANLDGQTRHLILLVKDLRELAQAESQQLPLHKQETDLVMLIDETLQIFEPVTEEKGVMLKSELEDNLPAVMVDASRMRQVLDNLIANALHHTPSGGKITIRGAATNRGIQLTVQDTGEGISPEDLPHVFDRFYRTDRSRSRETGGTGLGLAIVKALVEVHGGQVQVDSQGLGQGTCFIIKLPG
jgi:signal transduction histidine kinase